MLQYVLGVSVYLCCGESLPLRVPVRWVTNLGSEVTDDENGGVSHLLELTQFAEDDRPAEGYRRSRRIETEFDPQRPAQIELGLELITRHDLIGMAEEALQRVGSSHVCRRVNRPTLGSGSAQRRDPVALDGHNGTVTTDGIVDDLDLGSINELLEAGKRWRHGPFRELKKERIGLEYGLSGRTYRLSGTTWSAGHRTLVIKVESADKIGRAAAFRTVNEEHLSGAIPASYGWYIEDDRGLILLEDVTAAEQGDELVGCSVDEAESVIDVVAHLHSVSWLESGDQTPAEVERWVPRAWEAERWEDRMGRAHFRYRDRFTANLVETLADFNEEALAASKEIGAGPATWIHHDPHLDNLLWRIDGSPVLLDWSGAVIGPPAVDLAVLVMSLSLGEQSPMRPADVISSYTAALNRHGVSRHAARVSEMTSLGLKPLMRGLIGWAGYPGEDPQGRQLALRDDAVSRVIAGLEWLDSVSSG